MNSLKFNSLVSVCMITYKHESFIEKAIEGVLMQNVNFSVELIIADDCSPDNTEDIVRGYQQNHPNGHWIKYIRHERNKGMVENFVWSLKQCIGKYIAICEGDDFWCDKNKLQVQFACLEKDSKIVLSCHNVLIQDNIGVINKRKSYLSKNSLVPYDDLLTGKFQFITVSSFFRNILTNEMFERVLTNPIGDFPLWIQLYGNGDIFYFSKCMAVYRFNGLGEWSSKLRVNRQKIMLDIVSDPLNINPSNKVLLRENAFLNLSAIYLFDPNLFKTIIYERNFSDLDFSVEFHEYLMNFVRRYNTFRQSVFYKLFIFYHRVFKRNNFK